MKKILIVGNICSLAEKLASLGAEIYAAPGMKSDMVCNVDIREDDASGLLRFAVDNEIDLTIAVSEKAINSDIASVFQANEKLIFAPAAKSADFAISKALGKRFLYKLHAPTPKFGIFEKPQLAFEYLKNANYPIVVRCDTADFSSDRRCCTTFEQAKDFTEDLFYRGEQKVIMEDYVYGHEFTLYVVTDGYLALPLAVVKNFKFSESGDGGVLTSGIGAYVPDYKIPQEVLQKIYKNIVLNTLQMFQKKGTPYVGILGVEAVLTSDDTYTVLEFKPFLQDFDCQAVLNSVDENLIELFEACANGSFADEYDEILLNDCFSASCVVSASFAGEVIPNLDFITSNAAFTGSSRNKYFEYISVKGNCLVLTSSAKTLSRAKKNLLEDLDLIKFLGMKYRKDITLEKF